MNTIKLTKDAFKKEVLDSSVPVIVDFYADWCGPCKMIAPVMEEIAKENLGLKVCKVNVDEEGDLAMQYGVMSIPTIVVFKNGQIVNQQVGFRNKEAILEMVK
ncbi:MAG: thioredoxin [Bacilli bacterium]|nr:thioredoxin [Bacilli bacterium]MDD4734389.1 thioredoxin [Bacilli bacterium]